MHAPYLLQINNRTASTSYHPVKNVAYLRHLRQGFHTSGYLQLRRRHHHDRDGGVGCGAGDDGGMAQTLPGGAAVVSQHQTRRPQLRCSRAQGSGHLLGPLWGSHDLDLRDQGCP